MSNNTEPCPDCGHAWRAHHMSPTSRSRGVCDYRPYAGYQCPCQQPDPEVVAADRAAGAAWRAFMS